MRVKGLRLAWIVVKDLKKAVAFYKEIIGLEIHVYDEKRGWAELIGEEKGARLGILQSCNQELILAGQNAVVTLAVEDIQKARKELFEHGIKMVGEVIEIQTSVKLQMVQDPDGNYFQLVQSL